MAKRPARPKPARSHFPLDCVLVFAAAIAVYSNSFTVPFLFDDKAFIVDNPVIRQWQDPLAVWAYHPSRFLPFLSLALNYANHGLQVWGYHAVNLAIHLATTASLGWLVSLLLATPPLTKSWTLGSRGPVLLTMALFAVHPLQTQAVTYVWQRTAAFAALFYLLTLALFLKYRLQRLSSHSGRGKWGLAAFGAGVLAMFCKENTFTLPLALLASEVLFLKTVQRESRRVYAAFASLLLVIPATVWATYSLYADRLALQTGVSSNIPPLDYLLTQVPVTLTYLRLFLLPVSQNLDYDYPLVTSFFSLTFLLKFGVLLAILWAAWRLFKVSRVLGFGLLLFFLALSVEAMAVTLPDVIFEHRMYLPMAGLALFSGFGLPLMLRKNKTALPLIGAAWVCCLAVLSYQRNQVWQDPETLWLDVSEKSRQKARPRLNLAIAREEKGMDAKALADFDQAAKLDPHYDQVYLFRGLFHQTRGREGAALNDYDRFLSLRPDHALALNNRGMIYHQQQKHGLALGDFDRALVAKPDYGVAFHNRALAKQATGQLHKALQDYQAAVALLPRDPEPLYNRGTAYEKQGQFELAMADYRACLQRDSRFKKAHLSLAILTFRQNGPWPQVQSHFEDALSLDPEFAGVFLNRGAMYLNQGKFRQALSDFQALVALRPDGDGFYRRGLAQMKLGDTKQAAADMDRASALGVVIPPDIHAYLRRLHPPSNGLELPNEPKIEDP